MPRKTTPGGSHGNVQAEGTLTLPVRCDQNDPAGGFVDGDDGALSVDRNARCRVVLSTDIAGNPPNIGVTPFILAASAGAIGSAAAPGAGTNVVTIAAGSLPPGTYDVDVIAYASVAGAKNNMQLLKGAAVISNLLVPAVANSVIPPRRFRVVLDGSTALNVNAIAADAGATYEAELIATRIG